MAIDEATERGSSRTSHTGIECEQIDQGNGRARSRNGRRELKSPSDATTFFPLLEVVEADVEHLSQKLQLRVRPAILALPNIRCDWLARHQFTAWRSPCADGKRQTFLRRRVRGGARAGLAIDDQAEHTFFAAEILENVNLLLHMA